MGSTPHSEAEAPPERPAKPVILDILPEAVPEYWDRIEDMIRAAINASTVQPKLETPGDVLQLLVQGIYRLHVVVDGKNGIQICFISMIVEHARTRVLHIVYGAGKELGKWFDHFRSQICEGAREQNCRFIEIHVPDETRGEIIKRCGFTQTSSVYTLEI